MDGQPEADIPSVRRRPVSSRTLWLIAALCFGVASYRDGGLTPVAIGVGLGVVLIAYNLSRRSRLKDR